MAEISFNHMRTGVNFHTRVPDDITMERLKLALIVAMKKRIGRNHVKETPDDIIFIQDNKQFSENDNLSKANVQSTSSYGEKFYVLYYILSKDFEAESRDHSHFASSSVAKDDPPMDGLCQLADEAGDFMGYKVIFYDGDGAPHVQTNYGIYQVNLEEFCRDQNVLIVHDDEDYKERLIEDFIQFLNQRVPPDMLVNVLTREGMSLTSSDLMFQSDAVNALLRTFFQTKDIQKIKAIHSKFLELLEHDEESNQSDEQTIAETTTQVPEGDLSEIGASVADEIAEPEDEPSGVGLVVQLKSLLKEPYIINDFVIQKGWSVAKLRDEILKEHGIPLSKSKTVKLYNPRTMKYLLENTRIKVSTLVTRNDLADGDELHLSTNITGGARVASKPTKKDMTMKANEYKKATSEASSLINRQSIASLTAVQTAEKVLQTFANEAEVNVETALMNVLGNLGIGKLDTIYAEIAKKGGNMETKLSAVSVEVFALEEVAVASDSISNVLQSASSMLQYGVAKLNAENKVKDMSALKTFRHWCFPWRWNICHSDGADWFGRL
eukprot:Skav232175  [mRNA]  locus=scaffold4749:111877:113532:+ [translate_table: standard]